MTKVLSVKVSILFTSMTISKENCLVMPSIQKWDITINNEIRMSSIVVCGLTICLFYWFQWSLSSPLNFVFCAFWCGQKTSGEQKAKHIFLVFYCLVFGRRNLYIWVHFWMIKGSYSRHSGTGSFVQILLNNKRINCNRPMSVKLYCIDILFGGTLRNIFDWL